MKSSLVMLIILLIFGINSQFLRNLQSPPENGGTPPSGEPPSGNNGVGGSSSNTYDYTNYQAVSTNENLSNSEKISTTSDQSVVYITESGKTITDSTITKESGVSSNIENSEFFGVNAAVLVQGGGLTISGGTINTKAQGANALCVTNQGTATITGTTITSTGESSARGLHATYGGTITAVRVTVSSTGGSCATLATDRGEGTVTCSGCNLSTGGSGSPLIYSTGVIKVTDNTEGTATRAQAVVVEGKNSATVENSNLKCNGIGNRNNVDKCGVMLYQSMSGDADSGTSTFNCKSSTIEILSQSDVYSTAPMFFITNTDAEINLESCTFTYGSNIFLSSAGTSEWGSSGTNGGVVTLNVKNQQIFGNFEVDSNSGLTIKLSENSSLKGTINSAKTAAKLNIILDSTSSIELTGNSCYTSIQNANNEGTNILNGTFTWSKTEEKEISRPSGGQNGNQQNPQSPPNQSNQSNQSSPSDTTTGGKSNSNKLSFDLFMLLLTILIIF
jgi:hypothetical protein